MQSEIYDLALADEEDGKPSMIDGTLNWGSGSLLNASLIRTERHILAALVGGCTTPYPKVTPTMSRQHLRHVSIADDSVLGDQRELIFTEDNEALIVSRPASTRIMGQSHPIQRSDPTRLQQQQRAQYGDECGDESESDSDDELEDQFSQLSIEQLQTELACRKRLLYLKQKRAEKLQNLTLLRSRDLKRVMHEMGVVVDTHDDESGSEGLVTPRGDQRQVGGSLKLRSYKWADSDSDSESASDEDKDQRDEAGAPEQVLPNQSRQRTLIYKLPVARVQRSNSFSHGDIKIRTGNYNYNRTSQPQQQQQQQQPRNHNTHTSNTNKRNRRRLHHHNTHTTRTNNTHTPNANNKSKLRSRLRTNTQVSREKARGLVAHVLHPVQAAD